MKIAPCAKTTDVNNYFIALEIKFPTVLEALKSETVFLPVLMTTSRRNLQGSAYKRGTSACLDCTGKFYTPGTTKQEKMEEQPDDFTHMVQEPLERLLPAAINT